MSGRRYLPQSWADDSTRRERAHFALDLSFAPKPTLTLALIDQAVAWGVPFAAVTADAGDDGSAGIVRMHAVRT